MKPHYLLLGILFCYTSVAAQIDRSQQPQPGPEPEINFGSPQEYRFSNGLTLLVVENHKLPQVSVSLRIDNPLYPEGDKAGINQLLSEMMGKGSKSIEKDAFEEEIDFMGAHFHFNLDGAHASSLTRYFPRVFEMLADATLHPNFVPEEFEKEKEKAIEGLKTAEKDVKTAARRVQNLLSYGAQHPYGEYTTEGSLQNSTLEDLMKQYQQIYHAKNAYLIVVGDINFKATKKQAKKHFGRWKAGVIKTTSFPAPENVSETQIAFVEMPNAVQSEIAALFTSDLDKNNPDYYAAIIANQILGGGGEARLFLNLREDKGFTYGAYSNLSGDHKTKARLRVATSVRNAVTDSAVVKLHYEIDRMSKELVTDEELDLVKNKYAGSLIRSLEDPENIANFTYNVKTQNLPDNFYNNLLKNIKKVTKKDILRASKKYLSAGQLRIVVTGKGSDILSPLEALKINGMPVKVSYFDKWGTATEGPAFSKPIPEGTTAQSVIEGYLDAIGGRAQLEKIQTKHSVYEASMQGMTLQMEEKKAGNTKMIMEIKMMGNTMQRIVINQANAYMEMQGQRMDLKGDEKDAVMEGLPLFPELFYTDQIELIGIVDWNDKEVFEIKINPNKTVFYDTQTFLKVAEVELQNDRSSTTQFGPYKDVSGIKVPEKIQSNMGPQEVTFNLINIAFNRSFSNTDIE